MNESRAENLFIKDVRAQGGVAVKLRHRFMAGLPDLFVKMPDLQGVFIECKYAPWPKGKPTILLNLTPLQRNFLLQMQSVGQPAGWVLFSDVAGVKSALVGSIIGATTIDLQLFLEDRYTRARGDAWSVRSMVHNLGVIDDYRMGTKG